MSYKTLFLHNRKGACDSWPESSVRIGNGYQTRLTDELIMPLDRSAAPIPDLLATLP